ncbi:MAG TPA: molybdate ABC transporter permease subunit [Fibrobacteraceae bacterium]|nr:molybdate ABC transporter permease subunit [Fibrobacteraceae bacterium]
MDYTPLYLSLKLATLTTVILLPLLVPVAWWLSFGGAIRTAFRVVLTLPLVLPPTVLGFYLLLLFSPNGGVGHLVEQLFGTRLVFTFAGMLCASVIFSIPFLLNPLLAGFESLSSSMTEAAYTLGKSPWTTLWRVQLPNMLPSILSGVVLCFAHSMGEFGVILMIGGKIPGKTQVASMAVYDLVEAMEYHQAGVYALLLASFSFVALLSMFLLEKRLRGRMV